MRVKTLRTLKVAVDFGNHYKIPKGVVYEDNDIPQIVIDEIKRGNRFIQILDKSGYDKFVTPNKKQGKVEKTEEDKPKTIKKRVKK